MPSEKIILGLGSNVGDRRRYLDEAIAALTHHSLLLLQNAVQSSIHGTPALLPENAPADWDIPFLNMVLAGTTSATPDEALKAAKEIEQQLGRQDRGRWGPREIDIDILALGKTILATESLILPHPEMTKRGFVMWPLAEIEPDWRHPQTGVTATEYAQRLQQK